MCYGERRVACGSLSRRCFEFADKGTEALLAQELVKAIHARKRENKDPVPNFRAWRSSMVVGILNSSFE